MTKLQTKNSPCDSPASTNEHSLLSRIVGNRAFLGALVVSGAVFLYSANSKTENSEVIPPQPVPAEMVPPEPIPEIDRMPARKKVIEPIVPEVKAEVSPDDSDEKPIDEELRIQAEAFFEESLKSFESNCNELGLTEIHQIELIIKGMNKLQAALQHGNTTEIRDAAADYLWLLRPLEMGDEEGSVERECRAAIARHKKINENTKPLKLKVKSTLIFSMDFAQQLLEN